MKYAMDVCFHGLTPQQVAEVRDAIESRVPATVDVSYTFTELTETEVFEEDLNIKALGALRDEGLTNQQADAVIQRLRHAGLTFKEKR
jgi:hypothetical protein